MKLLVCLCLLVTSQFANAITKAERDCVERSVYEEVRSLSKLDWLKTANVAYNRKVHFKEWHFNSKSANLCDIVKSPDYPSRNKFRRKIKEPEKLKEIHNALARLNWYNVTNALYFTFVNGRQKYSLHEIKR